MSQQISVKYDFIKRQTFKAWHLQVDRKIVYAPKSICAIDLDNKIIEMPYWLAEKAGIEAYSDDN